MSDGVWRPCVVFVDDDRDVLDGLRRSLRPERKRWQLEFVGGTVEALELIAHESVDVVVTDMRMPAPDGAALLEALRRDHPGIVRMVLSGESSALQASRSLPSVHRWLAKPCDRTELVAAIEDALAARGAEHDTALISALGGVSSLPSPPTVYAELVELVADERADHGSVAQLVESDPAVAAKLLQWGRSPFVGLGDHATVRDVVRAVGHRAVIDLVLSVEVLEQMSPEAEIPGYPSEALRCHGELTSRVAVRLVNGADEPACRTAGLLHEVGLLVAATRLHEPLVEAVELARSTGIPLDRAQTSVLGHTHDEIGALLLSLWGLPSAVVEVVRARSSAHVDPGSRELPAEAAVRVASWISARHLVLTGMVDPVFCDPSTGSLAEHEPAWLARAAHTLDEIVSADDAPGCAAAPAAAHPVAPGASHRRP